MASTEQQADDSYKPGQLTQLLQSSSGKTDCDSALASLFLPAPPPAAAKKPAVVKSSTSAGNKSAAKQPLDEEPPAAKRQKLQPSAAKKQSDTAPEQELSAKAADAAVGERAAAKARLKLAKQREKARQEDPRNPRTVFVGNVSSSAKKRDLLLLFRVHGPIESVRFRSAAPADANVVKRLAVIHKKLSRPSLNAYVVYKEIESTINAAKALNGHCLAGLHLRVDCLAAGAAAGGVGGENQRDDKKCVFLGNLPFKCDEESIRSAFAQCGRVTNVRLVRDSRTGIGRGFGYVQFADASAVELALKLNGTELAGRQARVSRCSEQKQQAKTNKIEKTHKKKQKRVSDSNADSKVDNKKQAKPKSKQTARPTNQNFAQAFQRMLDKRRSRQDGKKPKSTAKSAPTLKQPKTGKGVVKPSASAGKKKNK